MLHQVFQGLSKSGCMGLAGLLSDINEDILEISRPAHDIEYQLKKLQENVDN